MQIFLLWEHPSGRAHFFRALKSSIVIASLMLAVSRHPEWGKKVQNKVQQTSHRCVR